MRKVSEVIRPNLKYQEAIVNLTRKGDKAKAKECLEAYTRACEGGIHNPAGHLSAALEVVLQKKGAAAVEEVRSEWARSLNLADRYEKGGKDRAELIGDPLFMSAPGLKQKVVLAIDKGDPAEVKAAVEAYYKVLERAGKDKTLFGGITLEWIRKNIGEEAVGEVFRTTLGMKSFYGKRMDDIGQDVEKLLAAQEGLKGGLGAWTTEAAYTITETDDEISYDYTGCHSGGTFRRGTLDKKDWGLLKKPGTYAINDAPGDKAQPGLRGRNDSVKVVPGPFAKGEKGLYPYCCHCGALDEVYKAKGTLLQFHYGADPEHGDPCRFIVRKPKGSKATVPTPWFKKWE